MDHRTLIPIDWRITWEADRGPCVAVPFPLSREPAPMHDAGWQLLRHLVAQAPIVPVALAELVATQAGVAVATLEALAAGLDPGPPLVVRWRGVTYINDGHHRATAAWLRGDATLPVRLLDLDAILAAPPATQSP